MEFQEVPNKEQGMQEQMPEKPWEFKPGELNAPRGTNASIRVWLDDKIQRQLAGIPENVRPQRPKGLSKTLDDTWKTRVWSAWLRSRSVEERRAIYGISEGRENHSHPSTGATPPKGLRGRR